MSCVDEYIYRNKAQDPLVPSRYFLCLGLATPEAKLGLVSMFPPRNYQLSQPGARYDSGLEVTSTYLLI